LAARSMIEVLTYPFTSDAQADALRWEEADPRRHSPRLANPLSDELPRLRGAILPTLLGAAQRNVGRGFEDLALFEVGAIFQGSAGAHDPPRPGTDSRPSAQEWAALQDLLPDQPTHIAGVWCGNREAKDWQGAAQPHTWSDALEAARYIGQLMDVQMQSRSGSDPAFHPGRCAELVVDATVVGVAGELHPAVCEAWGLAPRTCAMELNFSVLLDHSSYVRPAPRFSTHPVAKEDIALVVAENIAAGDVEQAVRSGAGELLEEVALFDVYTGDQVPEGQKSLAFALRFRAPDRTLAAEEIANSRQGAIKAAERLGARLR